jgi:hypothetical protein
MVRTANAVASFPAMDDAGLPALIEAIRHMHSAEAQWIESIPVREEHEGHVVWDGEVQRFALTGHPKAKECFAWSHATEGTRRRFHAVLRLPPVDSATMAMRTAALSEAVQGRSRPLEAAQGRSRPSQDKPGQARTSQDKRGTPKQSRTKPD